MKATTPALRHVCVSLLTFWAALTAHAATAGTPAEKPVPAANIEVKFTDPDKFTDIGDGPFSAPKVRQYDLDVIRAFLVKRAPTYLAASQRLQITFTDIDLVGGFPEGDDKRIWSRGYPPSLKFSFRLIDADGKVLKEGQRLLSDPNFDLKRDNVDLRDPLPKERGMLEEWLKDELRSSSSKT